MRPGDKVRLDGRCWRIETTGPVETRLRCLSTSPTQYRTIPTTQLEEEDR